VEVPLERNRPGVFSRMFNSLPFIGDNNAPKKPGDKDAVEAGTDTASKEPAGEGTDNSSAEPKSTSPPEPQPPSP